MTVSTLIVILVVLGSVVYVGKRFLDASRGKSGCSCGSGTCSGCQNKKK